MRGLVGRQPADRHGERSYVAGSLRPGKGNSSLFLPRSHNINKPYPQQVYQLISRRRFQQMEVLEGQNILVTISGKKNRVRVYYLSWLKSKILRTDGLSDVGYSS